jgi:hypothetical protein
MVWLLRYLFSIYSIQRQRQRLSIGGFVKMSGEMLWFRICYIIKGEYLATQDLHEVTLKVVTNEKGEAVGEVVTIIY